MTRPLRVSAGRPVVIDTSVAFKWFDRTESGADVAEQLLDAHGRDEVALVVPAHFSLEILNVHQSRGASLKRLLEVVDDLATADLLIAPLEPWLLADAAQIATAAGLTLYDATFIALAARIDATLVTADRRQAATSACEVRLIG